MNRTYLIRRTVEHFLIVECDTAERSLESAKSAPSDEWSTGKQDYTVVPTCGKFILGEALNKEGAMVPAWGFDFQDIFVFDAKVGDSCDAFGLTQEESDELDRLNAGRGLL